jgi:hypothetical protein
MTPESQNRIIGLAEQSESLFQAERLELNRARREAAEELARQSAEELISRIDDGLAQFDYGNLPAIPSSSSFSTRIPSFGFGPPLVPPGGTEPADRPPLSPSHMSSHPSPSDSHFGGGRPNPLSSQFSGRPATPNSPTQSISNDNLASALMNLGPSIGNSLREAFAGGNFAESLHSAQVKAPVLYSFDAKDIRLFLKAYRRYQAQGGLSRLVRFLDGDQLEKLASFYIRNKDEDFTIEDLRNRDYKTCKYVLCSMHHATMSKDARDRLSKLSMPDDNLSWVSLEDYNLDFEFECDLIGSQYLPKTKEIGKAYVQGLRPVVFREEIKAQFPDSLEESMEGAKDSVKKFIDALKAIKKKPDPPFKNQKSSAKRNDEKFSATKKNAAGRGKGAETFSKKNAGDSSTAREVPAHITCFKCGGNHYANACTDDSPQSPSPSSRSPSRPPMRGGGGRTYGRGPLVELRLLDVVAEVEVGC